MGQAKKIQSEKSQCQKLAEVLKTHLRQSVDRVGETVERLHESAKRVEQSNLKLVKVSR